MDRRLIILPIILVIGSVILLSGIMNNSDDKVPDVTEQNTVVTEEPEEIFQSTDVNDTDMNETVLEEAPSNSSLGGMGGGGMGGGGLPASKPVTPTPVDTTPSNDTNDTDDTDDNDESDEVVETPAYTFYIKVE
jgi:hypothetical protein